MFLQQNNSFGVLLGSPAYLVSGSQNQKHIGYGFLLVELALNPVRYWLVTLTGFEPLLHQSILQEGHHCRKKTLQLGWCFPVSLGSMMRIFKYHKDQSIGMMALSTHQLNFFMSMGMKTLKYTPAQFLHVHRNDSSKYTPVQLFHVPRVEGSKYTPAQLVHIQ